MEKTPWFDGDVKPCADRVGLYERFWNGFDSYMDWWDGVQWRFAENDSACAFQELPWRGLTKEAK